MTNEEKETTNQTPVAETAPEPLTPEKEASLAVHLIEAQEEERQRVARLLHDEIGQNLTALGFNLDFVESQLPESVASVTLLRERLEKAQRLVEKTTDQIREVIVDLRPPMLNEYGLVEALEWYVQHLTTQTDLTIIFETDNPTLRLEPRVENVLFRIIQEALTNTIEHAQATQAKISLTTSPLMTRFIIADDGLGFDSKQQIASARSGVGLFLMKQRAASIQARCSIKSEHTKGTQVIIEMPYENQHSVG